MFINDLLLLKEQSSKIISGLNINRFLILSMINKLPSKKQKKHKHKKCVVGGGTHD